MNNEQAIELLTQATGMLKITREEHKAVISALEHLKNTITYLTDEKANLEANNSQLEDSVKECNAKILEFEETRA